ncbi:MAG: AMP nucleosidase [Micavibrio aeruginosavorus]|uniref:AMP nucleosidase n=1 Tax=Micavibrio aeruginosavorus TaxID=349221 RepID=A0A2W5MY11_9BACT|nr:MAG: AMP nucleosidase [Micavibrio aeruginosavorus]
MLSLFKSYKTKSFKNADDAFAAIEEIYNGNVSGLREAFRQFAKGQLKEKSVRGYYPFIRFKTETTHRPDTRLAYGFVSRSGTYETTITRPDIFDVYYKGMIGHLLKNHGGSVEVGLSETVIPLHFALGEDFHIERDLTHLQMETLPHIFDQPDLTLLDDTIPNGTYVVKAGGPMPLALFPAPRVDLSLMRLKHYTGTKAAHFQNYVIFTNYQFYIDEFIKLAMDMMTETSDPALRRHREQYTAFVEPGDKVTANKNTPSGVRVEADEQGAILRRLPQMPAYHLKRADGSGITMVNIGVGPSNAKTITDHIAVLRPHAWVMLGHCAGLRNSQSLGDYVLAHAYLREDNVLYHDLHPNIPIPALAEIQVSLEQAVSEITGHKVYDLKKIMRTGTVATVDDRNWELRPAIRQNLRLSQSRAIALDMESGTIAANGFRFRVPYGTLLCVSDKPLHGQLKLPGMADSFYRERVEQHLKIGLRTMEILRGIGPERLHSRKLRSFNEVAFQ